jgi:hypothetical protein
MNILIPLFIISFVAITIMFNRKLSLIQNKDVSILEKELSSLEIPYVVEIKYITTKKIKRYSYVALVTIIRLYFRSINLLKVKHTNLKTKLSNWHKRDIKNGSENKEVNKFLRMVSDYKYKIRKIKHNIKKEEEEKITPP